MSKTILIIEDEILLRKPMSITLQGAGYIVIEARDGKEGLEQALKIHPDLILLDLVMPEMDGIEVLKKLRADAWGKIANVCVLTHLNSMEKVAEATELGAKEYIVKSDIKLEDLVVKVKNALN